MENFSKQVRLFQACIMYILYGLPNCLRAGSMKFNKVWLWLTWALNMKIIYKLKLCGPTLPAETIFQNPGPESWDRRFWVKEFWVLVNALLCSIPAAKALLSPADADYGGFHGFLENLKVGDHREMVWGEGQGGKSVLADLLLGGHV